MPKIKPIAEKELIKIANQLGFFFVRQKGSHVILRNEHRDRVTIPLHDALRPGTLLAILKELKITKEELEKLRNQTR